MQQAIEETAVEASLLTILFNNAGIFQPMFFETVTPDNWKRRIGTNLWNVISRVHAAIPIMLRQGSSHIVNTSSIAGLMPYPVQGDLQYYEICCCWAVREPPERICRERD